MLCQLDPDHARLFTTAFIAAVDADYDTRVDDLLQAASHATKQENARLDREWRSWAHQAFAGGAGAARRASQVRQRLELPAATQLGGPSPTSWPTRS